MTIAVACTLADGVIMGVDSAVTLQYPTGAPQRIYADGEKLFTLWSRPIAVATWGLAAIQARTIGSYISEFEARVDEATSPDKIEDVARELWKFLNGKILGAIAGANPPLAPDQRRLLGLLVGGFSRGGYLPELWEINAQQDDEPKALGCIAAPGAFTAVWRGLGEGISRYVKGASLADISKLYDMVLDHHGLKSDAALEDKIIEKIDEWQYTFSFNGMPLQEGVDYVRFLLDIEINTSKFVDGAYGCGGPVRIVVVRNQRVQWVANPTFRITH